MKAEKTTTGHSQNDRSRVYALLTIAALAILALVLCAFVCVDTEDSSADGVEVWHSGQADETTITTVGTKITLTATRTEGIAVPAEWSTLTTAPWAEWGSARINAVTTIELRQFSGNSGYNTPAFNIFVNAVSFSGDIYDLNTMKIGTWSYSVTTLTLTVTADEDATLMPSYFGNLDKIPWRNCGSISNCKNLTITKFKNSGRDAFKDITDIETINGELYKSDGYVNGVWSFNKSTGILLIEETDHPDNPQVMNMYDWEVDYNVGKDTRPWSFGKACGSDDDWDWYQYVLSIKVRNFKTMNQYIDSEITKTIGGQAVVVAELMYVGDIARESSVIGEWAYIEKVYKLRLTANNRLESLPTWTSKYATPWFTWGFWDSIQEIELIKFNGYYSEWNWAKGPSSTMPALASVITIGDVTDTDDSKTVIGDWTYHHKINDSSEDILEVTSFEPGISMPRWSIDPTDERPWGGYNWIPNVTLVQISFFSDEGDDKAFYGFTSLQTKKIVGVIQNKLGLMDGTWTYNSTEKSLVLEALEDGTEMMNYTASSKAPWSSLGYLSGITTVEITKYSKIGEYAFQGMTSVKVLNSDSATSLNAKILIGITGSLEEVNMSALTTLTDGLFLNSSTLRVFQSASLVNVNQQLFKGCTALEYVILPSATEIKGSAFDSCSSLIAVTIAEEVNIGGSAFYKCTSLKHINSASNGVNLEHVLSIGNSAFQYSGVERVIIGNLTKESSSISAKVIGTNVFAYCTELDYFYTDSITSMSYGQFLGCTALREFHALKLTTCFRFDPDTAKCSAIEIVDIPSATRIVEYAFRYCKALTTVILPTEESEASKPEAERIKCRLDYQCFYDCEALVNINLNRSYFYSEQQFCYCYALESVYISQYVQDIPNYCFKECTSLASVTFNNTGCYGYQCFYHCILLETVDLSLNKSTSVNTYISGYAFYDCQNLREVTISEYNRSINEYVFYNCILLTEIDTGRYCTTLGNGAFMNCAALTTVTMYENCTSITYRAFYNCKKLESISATGCTGIGSEAFYQCNSLESAEFSPNLSTLSDYSTFYACKALKEFDVGSTPSIPRYAFQACYSLEKITLSNVTTISYYSFEGCSKLKTVIGDNIRTIDYNAFQNCVLLETFSFKNVSTIGNYAFYVCEKLTEVDAPVVTSIGTQAFYKCIGLVELKMPNVEILYESSFSQCTSIEKVSANSLSRIYNYVFYRNTSLKTIEMENIQNIQYQAFYMCNNLEYIKFGDSGSTKIIVGEQAFYGCLKLDTGETRVNFENIYSIGHYSFYSCSGLTEVTFPRLYEMLGSYNFGNCGYLRSITMDAVKNTGPQCFVGCTNLEYVSANSVTSIGYQTCSGCKLLEEVHFDSAITYNGYCFDGCSYLTQIGNIPNTANLQYVVTLGDGALRGTAIKELKFGCDLVTMGYQALASMKNVETIILPNSLETIGNEVMTGTNLSTIVFPSSLRTVGGYFIQCYGTTVNIWFNGSMDNIGRSSTNAMIYCHPGYKISYTIHLPTGSNPDKITRYVNGNVSIKFAYHATSQINFIPANIEEHSLTPSYGTVKFIDGSRIVLPYGIYDDVEYVNSYGVQTSSVSVTALGLVKAGADPKTSDFAESGDAVYVYTEKENMTFTMGGVFKDDEEYDTKLTRTVNIISTGSLPEGVTPIPEQKDYYYGDDVLVPKLQSDDGTKYTVVKLVATYGNQEFEVDVSESSFKLGCYVTQIDITIDQVYIKTTLVDRGTTTEVQLLFGSYYDSLPSPTPDIGYYFDGWYEYEGGKGQKMDGSIEVKRSMTLYSNFKPVQYPILIYSTNPQYETTKYLEGQYTLIPEGSNIYYTDVNHPDKTLLFEADNIVSGYKFSAFWRDKTIEFTEPYTPTEEELKKDHSIRVVLEPRMYSINLQFYLLNDTTKPMSGEEIDNVIIEGLVHGTGIIYNNGDTVSGITYDELVAGYVLPMPKSNDGTFYAAYAKYSEVKYVEIKQDGENNNKMLLTTDYFLEESLTVRFTFVVGQYRAQFIYNDDDKTISDTGLIDTTKETVSIRMRVVFDEDDLKSGYTFKGWTLDGEHLYASNEVVVLTDDLLAYAEMGILQFKGVWEKKTYTINYDLTDYKEGKRDPTKVTFESVFFMPDVTGYGGHTLYGWQWSNADGTILSDPIKVGDQVNIDKALVDTYSYDGQLLLKAVWSNAKYKIVTSEGGGSFTPKEATYLGTFTMWNHGDLKKENQKFAGWVAEGSIVYDDDEVVTIDDTLAHIGDSNNGVINFSINWIKEQYYVLYDLNEGSDPTGTIPKQQGPYYVGDPYDMPSGEALIRDGYNFAGWKYQKDAFTTYDSKGIFDSTLAHYAVDGYVTLYAGWSQITYKIAYSYQGGAAGESAPRSAAYGADITISNPVKSGYQFKGWTAVNLTSGACAKTDSGYVSWDGTDESLYTVYKDLCNIAGGTVTFTAQWDTLIYNVQYISLADEGTVIGGSENLAVGDMIEFPTLEDGRKTGYTFQGWGTDKYNAIEDGSTFTSSMAMLAVSNTITFYGVWYPISYTIEYVYYEGYATLSMKVEYDSIVQIPITERIGYSFSGWVGSNIASTAYTSSDQNIWYKWDGSLSNSAYFKNLQSVEGEVVRLEGQWTQNVYTLKYHSNAASVTDPVDDKTYKIGDKVTLVTTLDGNNGGKAFLGWSLDQSATTTTSITEFTSALAMYADVSNTVHLYGVWSEGTYVVTVDLQGCTASSIPAGWKLVSPGIYSKEFDYQTKMTDVMEEWSNVVLTKDGYTFSNWDYQNAYVTSDVNVKAIFTEVQKSLLYIFGAVLAVVIIGIIVYTRLEH